MKYDKKASHSKKIHQGVHVHSYFNIPFLLSLLTSLMRRMCLVSLNKGADIRMQVGELQP